MTLYLKERKVHLTRFLMTALLKYMLFSFGLFLCASEVYIIGKL